MGDAVPLCGISVASLRAFAAAHAGRDLRPSLQEHEEAERSLGAVPRPVPQRFEELTTAQVVERVIKPATEAARCSYVDLLRAQRPTDDAGHPAVAPATVFVSHAWSYAFGSLLQALLARFAHDTQPVYLWNGASVTV